MNVHGAIEWCGLAGNMWDVGSGRWRKMVCGGEWDGGWSDVGRCEKGMTPGHETY